MALLTGYPRLTSFPSILEVATEVLSDGATVKVQESEEDNAKRTGGVRSNLRGSQVRSMA